MGRNAVGFYWTLPVPWAGFKELPKEIEAAAKASKTIRYQVQRIRSYAREQGFTLIREEVFIEVQPDRGTDSVTSALNKLEDYCRANAAALLYVDFAVLQGWRSHPHMAAWSQGRKIEILPVWPEPVPMDGSDFDPVEHFQDWRLRQAEWSNGKVERLARARSRAGALKQEGLSNDAIAAALNAEQLRSATGKDWSGEMVRKMLN